MRVYMDWEFLDHPLHRDVPPISIGLYSDFGDSYYAVFRELPFSELYGIDWLHDNVAPHLPVRPFKHGGPWNPHHPDWDAVTPTATIREEVRKYFDLIDSINEPDEQTELWGYYPSYDFFLLCKLFGRMMDLPGSVPRYIHDLKVEMKRLGVTSGELPPVEGRRHHALDDAKYECEVGNFLIRREAERTRS